MGITVGLSKATRSIDLTESGVFEAAFLIQWGHRCLAMEYPSVIVTELNMYHVKAVHRPRKSNGCDVLGSAR